MSTERKKIDDEIREVLRRGDPIGDGETLAAEEVERLRRTILAAAHTDTSRARRPARSLAFSLAAAALLGSITMFFWTPLSRLGTDRTAAGPSAIESEAGTRRGAVQQLQFVTPGGTQVVWTLDPDFDV